MIQKYKDIVLRNFSGGLNTKFEAADLDLNESPDMQNIVFDGKGSFGPRRGYEVFGSSAAGDGVKDTFSFKDRKGNQHVMKTNVSAVYYYNSYTADFEVLRDNNTPGLNWGFAYHGSATMDDFLFMGNGVDQMRAWHPRYLIVSGAVSATATVIPLSTSFALSALGWLSAGSFVLDGEEAYYASAVGNSLSCIQRVSNAANSYASQSPIAQLPISSGYTFTYDGSSSTYSLSGAPRGNVLKMFQSRLHIAGVSSAGEVDFYSKVDNPWDFYFNATTLSAGDGGAFSFSEGGGQIKGFGGKDDTLLVVKEDVIRTLRFSEDDIPIPGTVIDGQLLGAATSKSIVPIESDLWFMSPIGGVRSLKRESNETGFDLLQVAQKIGPSLQATNNVSCGAAYDGADLKWYTTTAASGAAFNNTVFVYDYVYNAWTRFAGINANDFFKYNNQIGFAASNENATYLLNQGFDDNGAGYEAYWFSPKLDYGFPHELKRLRYVYVEGWITENTRIRSDLYYNEDDSGYAKTISGNASYVSITGEAEEIGKSTFGLGTYGGVDSDETYLMYKFRVRLSYSNVDFFNMQLKFSSDQPGSVWYITKIAPYVEPMPGLKFPTEWVI